MHAGGLDQPGHRPRAVGPGQSHGRANHGRKVPNAQHRGEHEPRKNRRDHQHHRHTRRIEIHAQLDGQKARLGRLWRRHLGHPHLGGVLQRQKHHLGRRHAHLYAVVQRQQLRTPQMVCGLARRNRPH